MRATSPTLMTDDVLPLARALRRRLGADQVPELVALVLEHLTSRRPVKLTAEAEGFLGALREIWGVDGATILAEKLAEVFPRKQLPLFGAPWAPGLAERKARSRG